MVSFFGLDLPVWLVRVTVYVFILGFGWSLKKALFAWLRMATSKTETKIDDVIIAASNLPLTIMIAVWGASAVIHFVAPGVPPLGKHIATVSKISTVLAGILFIDLLLHGMLDVYAEKVRSLKDSHSFTSALIHVVVIAVGLLVLLDSMGVSITPIIASLGIGSLAVALALQPTFENIFAGLQLLIDQPIVPGHYIRLESGEEGFVEKIGWRTSWIRLPVNNTVILPNKQLVNARIINFNYPSKEMTVTVDVGVHYDSDLDKVEKIALAVGTETMKNVTGGVPEFIPMVRYGAFGASSINFTVVLRAQEASDAPLIKHEFIKNLSKRFANENIVFPYPVVAVNTRQEKAIF